MKHWLCFHTMSSKLKKIILVLPFLLSGCIIESSQLYQVKQSDIQINGNFVCISPHDAEEGDRYNSYIITTKANPVSNMKNIDTIAYKSCLPYHEYNRGVSYDVFYTVKDTNGEIKKYEIAFIISDNGKLVIL